MNSVPDPLHTFECHGNSRKLSSGTGSLTQQPGCLANPPRCSLPRLYADACRRGFRPPNGTPTTLGQAPRARNTTRRASASRHRKRAWSRGTVVQHQLVALARCHKMPPWHLVGIDVQVLAGDPLLIFQLQEPIVPQDQHAARRSRPAIKGETRVTDSLGCLGAAQVAHDAEVPTSVAAADGGSAFGGGRSPAAANDGGQPLVTQRGGLLTAASRCFLDSTESSETTNGLPSCASKPASKALRNSASRFIADTAMSGSARVQSPATANRRHSRIAERAMSGIKTTRPPIRTLAPRVPSHCIPSSPTHRARARRRQCAHCVVGCPLRERSLRRLALVTAERSVHSVVRQGRRLGPQ